MSVNVIAVLPTGAFSVRLEFELVLPVEMRQPPLYNERASFVCDLVPRSPDPRFAYWFVELRSGSAAIMLKIGCSDDLKVSAETRRMVERAPRGRIFGKPSFRESTLMHGYTVVEVFPDESLLYRMGSGALRDQHGFSINFETTEFESVGVRDSLLIPRTTATYRRNPKTGRFEKCA